MQSHCNEYADKYVEYELVIIVLDLILHHPRAYRHVLFNRLRLNDDEPAVILVRSPARCRNHASLSLAAC